MLYCCIIMGHTGSGISHENMIVYSVFARYSDDDFHIVEVIIVCNRGYIAADSIDITICSYLEILLIVIHG